MGLFKKFKDWTNRISDPLYDLDDWEDVEAWNEVVYDRDDLRINNKDSRQTYVCGCLEQIAEASKEVDTLMAEYETITSQLKDMEEIEALPKEEMDLVKGYARKINDLKDEQSGFLKRKNRMSDAKYRKLERMEEELAEGYKKLKEAED